jgi:hypothetical protein
VDATINQLPNTLSFDPAQCQPSLILGGRSSINPTTPVPSNGGELGHVTSILSDLRGLISNQTPPVTPFVNPQHPLSFDCHQVPLPHPQLHTHPCCSPDSYSTHKITLVFAMPFHTRMCYFSMVMALTFCTKSLQKTLKPGHLCW